MREREREGGREAEPIRLKIEALPSLGEEGFKSRVERQWKC